MKQYIFTFRYKKHDLQSYFDAFSCFLSPITIHYITAGWQQSPAYPLIQLCIISTSVTAEPKWAEPSRHIDSQIHTHTHAHTVQWYHSPGWWNDTVVGFAQLYRAKHIALRGTLPCKQMPCINMYAYIHHTHWKCDMHLPLLLMQELLMAY